MDEHDDLTPSQWRELRQGLRGLRATPPESLRQGALERVGLADAYTRLDTAIGPIFVAYNGRGVSATAPSGDPEAFEAAFRARFQRSIRPAAQLPPELESRLTRWLDRGRRADPPGFDLRGVSDFERSVLDKTQEIPRGEVRPYAWVAREIGRPGAVRSVGSALGRNPVPLLIPCHRVVRSDGRPGDYAWGAPTKRRALASEGVDAAELERLAARGTRYLGSDTTHVYCLPTCHNARRITPAHRIRFGAAAEAQNAGYRPCKQCRPAVLPVAG
jgi:O-6-methylguanine DNA methyltransferase